MRLWPGEQAEFPRAMGRAGSQESLDDGQLLGSRNPGTSERISCVNRSRLMPVLSGTCAENRRAKRQSNGYRSQLSG
jgi:hypothetical protein